MRLIGLGNDGGEGVGGGCREIKSFVLLKWLPGNFVMIGNEAGEISTRSRLELGVMT